MAYGRCRTRRVATAAAGANPGCCCSGGGGAGEGFASTGGSGGGGNDAISVITVDLGIGSRVSLHGALAKSREIGVRVSEKETGLLIGQIVAQIQSKSK